VEQTTPLPPALACQFAQADRFGWSTIESNRAPNGRGWRRLHIDDNQALY